jgi:hypothetical protein
MNSNTLLVILMTLIALGAAFFILSPPSDTGPAAAVSAQTSGVSQIVATAADPASPPTVDAGSDLTLNEGERVQLHGQASSTGGALHYHWSVASGQGTFSDPDRADPIFTAPAICGCVACVPVMLTVTTSDGATASDQLTVRVEGDPISCSSAATWNPCAAANPCPPKPAPAVSKCAPFQLPCDSPCVPLITPTPACPVAPVPCCSCPCGSAFVFWPPTSGSAGPGEHAAPLIDRHYPSWIDEGAAVRLSGRVNNPTCTRVCFTWSATKGTFENADTLTPIYHAPSSERSGGEYVTITLTVHDAFGGTAYDQIRLGIANTDYYGATSTQPENAWLLGQR